MQANDSDLNKVFPDKVCINLERRSDRWERMQARFAHHRINNVARFEAIDGLHLTIPASWDDFPGAYGCLMSHLAVIKDAFKNKRSSVLIIEDDVAFHPDLNSLFSQYIKELPADWDMLYFGALHGEPPILVTEHIAKLTHSLSTYAYVLKHTIYEAFIDLNRQALTVLDENTRALQKQFNCYCFMPHLAWVEEDYSDVREERSSLWWLSESLVLWGEDVDQLENRTVAVISYRGRTEASLKNLCFILRYFSSQLPSIALTVVEQAEHPTLNSVALPAACDVLFVPAETRGARGRSFNAGFELFSSRKEFFIFLDSDIFLSREDIRANLLRCRDHDFASACAEIWDLNDSDTARVINNDLRWNYNGNYQPRVKAQLCQSVCIMTKKGIELSGGWHEDDDYEGSLTSERVKQCLKVYQSPNPVRRLFQPE
jgi:glycosyl transferase, family 25